MDVLYSYNSNEMNCDFCGEVISDVKRKGFSKNFSTHITSIMAIGFRLQLRPKYDPVWNYCETMVAGRLWRISAEVIFVDSRSQFYCWRGYGSPVMASHRHQNTTCACETFFKNRCCFQTTANDSGVVADHISVEILIMIKNNLE